LAYITQTTLSVDDTAAIVAILCQRFPAIVGPRKDDICYATTNRQAAVKAIAKRCDALLVLGAPNSSNSQRLVEVARRAGCAEARLVQSASDLVCSDFAGVRTLGVSAGASAPELLVRQVVDAFRAHFDVSVQDVVTGEERVGFSLPRELRDASAA
jgi:4-hydroxy-3-methylbut-2-enyl diphosphate reductase